MIVFQKAPMLSGTLLPPRQQQAPAGARGGRGVRRAEPSESARSPPFSPPVIQVSLELPRQVVEIASQRPNG